LAREAVASGRADLIAFGKLFIANPDLVERSNWACRSTSRTRRRSMAAG
jgi:2,4-dienoyl-CoA reductase-like NADH-dependent reductase (Old Yellow Enzyme family)